VLITDEPGHTRGGLILFVELFNPLLHMPYSEKHKKIVDLPARRLAELHTKVPERDHNKYPRAAHRANHGQVGGGLPYRGGLGCDAVDFGDLEGDGLAKEWLQAQS